MEVTEITDKKVWDGFFNAHGSVSFHHSWEWGEVQTHTNHPIQRVGLYDKSNLKAIMLVIEMQARRGSFLFVPHGPIVDRSANAKTCYQHLRDHLIRTAQEKHSSFIRIAPPIEDTEENRELFTSLGFRTAPIYMHAETMWALDVTLDEEQLLSEMRKTTRYLVRKALKEVTIVQRTNDAAIDDFWKIYRETFTREHFVPFSKQFITEEFTEFSKTGNAVFLFGRANDSTDDSYLASALVLFTESTGFYHQGASIHTKYPVPYLLQWTAIQEAKKRGCKLYNFYGILKEGRTPKTWDGLTLFKKGFGGFELNFLPTQDYILSQPKYFFSYLYEKYLNWRRGV
jgi:peptidoglycan pentaglycine glycine transferase (the first glycine)